MAAPPCGRSIAGMRYAKKLSLPVLVMIALTSCLACGQKEQVHGGRGGAGTGGAGSVVAGTWAAPLPPECEDDARHCVVLTTFQGINVYRNIGPGGFCGEDGRCQWPENAYGTRWQCVELFNRFFSERFGMEPITGDARDLFANAAGVEGLELHANGSWRAPEPGDALVFTDAAFGHVAIVASVGEHELQVVEQNAPGNGTNRYRYDAATRRVLSGPHPGAVPVGWIHAVANGS